MEMEKITRKEQARRTRVQIFQAALALLDEKRFDDITIRDIVRSAGVSVGTFYRYYTSKREVYYETYPLADDYFEETVLPQLDQPTARERILAFFAFYARYSTDLTNPALPRILYDTSNPWFDRPDNYGMQRVLRVQVEAGIADGEFDPGTDPRMMTRFLMIAARGLVYNWCTHEGGYDLAPELNRYVRRLLLAYRPGVETGAISPQD